MDRFALRIPAFPKRDWMEGSMAAEHGLFLGWNRPARGREAAAVELFGSVIGYLGKQQKAGSVESFEPVFLAAHGGDLNGFIVVRGDHAKLAAMRATDEFQELIARVNMNVDGFGVIESFV